MYTIECEPESRLIRLVLSGFWDAHEAQAFVRDQQKAVRALGPPFDTHLTLADVRDFVIQTQDVGDIIRDLVLNATAVSRRIALVGGEGLARMQFRRVTAREDVRLFTSREDAEAWLTS